jgi:RHS repeat-associated protein
VIATTNTGQTVAGRQFEGLFTDFTNLVYSDARYLNPAQGQFISQDPTFLALGNPNQLQQISQLDQQRFLSDPQQLNSYSYGRDNPITQKDPAGNIVTEAADLVYKLFYLNTGRTAFQSYNSLITGVANNSPEQSSEQAQFLFDSGSLGASSLALFYVGDPVMAAAIDVGGIILSVRDSVCSTHTCKDFSGSQKTIGEILSTIPTGPMANPTLMPKANGGSSAPSGSSGNGPVSHAGTAQGGGSNGGASLSLAQQMASIQAQIQSIQAQINNYIQSISKGR